METMNSKNMKSSSSSARSSIERPFWQVSFTFIAIGFVFLARLPMAQAVNPAPDGGYAGGNTAEGEDALLGLTTGLYNTAVGFVSLETNAEGNLNTAIGAGTLLANTATENTAIGAGALLSNTTGADNTANGAFALFSNTEGNDNTASGTSALQSNTIGFGNTANGASALFSNTQGGQNTANGEGALLLNTTGNGNTANGALALSSNTIGNNNTANGTSALFSNTTGEGNTAIGSGALQANSTGGFNTADGVNALLFNTQGESNVADGSSALLRNTTGTGNTGVGNAALANITTGNANTALGDVAGFNLTTGDNNIDIGFNVQGVAGESNTIRIGDTDITDTFIRGISGTTVASGAAVLVAANGHLGTVTSSARFKDDIKPMDQASQMLFSLKPVTFHYKKDIDPAGTQQFGLVAEDVEKVNPDLVVRTENGVVNSVRYEQVNAMLLNEFLKEHKKVEAQQAIILELKSTVVQQRKDFDIAVAQQQKSFDSKFAEQEQQIEALASGLRTVSARLATATPSRDGIGLSKSLPQVVVNSHE